MREGLSMREREGEIGRKRDKGTDIQTESKWEKVRARLKEMDR